jgi:hypothetical protein
MTRITVEQGDVSLRYTKRDDDPFRWDLEFQMDERWVPMPRQSDALDGRDVLWSLTASVQQHVDIFGAHDVTP